MKKFTKSIVSLAVILSFLVGGIADYIPLLDSAVITSEAATESNWMWPTSARTLTSPNSKPNARRWGGVHGGIDIAGATGTNVFASKSGKVIAAQWHNSYGNYVKIQHGDGTYSLYAHMSKIEVKRTDNVKQGEIIGKIGSTGDSTGPHLHFEIRNKNDATINNNPAWRASGINGKSFDGKSKTNWTGSNGGWSGTIKWGEINYVFTPTTLAQPTVKTEKYYGGEKFTITAPSGAYVRYSTNGGKSTGYTNTGKRSVTLDVNFRTTNSLRVQSYQGSTSSAVKTIQSSTVGQVITPVVNYNSAKGTFTISAGSGSSAKEFFYTTNGCNPVVTTAGKAGTCSTHKQICTKKYGGSPVSVSTTSQTTVKAVAIMKGSINSSVRTVQCKPAAPGRPMGLVLNNTAARIPVGNTANVKWNALNTASSYEARLYRNGAQVGASKSTTGTTSAFQLTESGVYEIRVYAKNAGGTSTVYASVAVEAMANLTVKFLNSDGTSVDNKGDRIIGYNKPVTFPSNPSKVGHTFDGWFDGETRVTNTLAPITTNKTYVARFTPLEYSVMFFDTNGSRINAQSVKHGEAATLPAENEITISVGHIFQGWHIESESVGASYNYVDRDMKVYATQAWDDNNNLPIVAQINSAIRNSDALATDGPMVRYEIEVELGNFGGEVPPGWLMTVLKTQDGRMVASRNDAIRIGVPMTIMIDSDEVASRVEVVVVGRDGTKTGGALSNMVGADLTELAAYGWSNWSTALPPSGTPYESRTEYSYQPRIREETLSSISGSSGVAPDGGLYPWRFDKSVLTGGNWGSWLAWTTNPSYELRNISGVQQVDAPRNSSTIESYTMRYYRYRSIKTPNTWRYYRDKLSSSTLADLKTQVTSTGTYTRAQLNSARKIPQGSTATSGGTNSGINASSTQDGYVIDSSTGRIWFITGTNYKPEYRRRLWVNEYTHQWYRYVPGNWTNWSVNQPPSEIFGSAETRTMYRWEIPVGDMVDGEGEIGGETYTIQGTLSADTDLTGRKATIFVYKETNSDPNEEQREYVGQTEILPNNEYAFTFIPREPISARINEDGSIGTGDFIVALALEGSTNLVNIDIIKAPHPGYEVVFFADGEEISRETVNPGENATVPEVPEIEGKMFVGWDNSPTNITDKRSINAIFVDKLYVAVLVDFANDEVDMITDVGHGTGIDIPEKSSEGKIFKGWYNSEDETKTLINPETFVVTDHTLLIAEWEAVICTVIFVDKDGNTVDEQRIEYGEAANPPDALNDTEDMVFAGWSLETEWWRVNGDIIVEPVYVYIGSAESPHLELPDEYVWFDPDEPEEELDDSDEPEDSWNDHISLFKLNSSTENARISFHIIGDYALGIIDGDGEFIETERFVAVPPMENDPIDESEDGDGDGDDWMMTELGEYTPDTYIMPLGDITVTMKSEADGMNDSEIITIEVPYVEPWENYDEDWGAFLMADWSCAIPGDTIEIPVYISDVTGIKSQTMDVMLKYNNSVFTLMGHTLGDAFDVGDDVSGLLLTLIFKIDDNADISDYEITIGASASNEEGEPVEIEETIAVVSVIRCGDVNGDGVINAKDVTLLRRYILADGDIDFDFDWFAADCNGDGVIDAKDLTRLRRYLAGGWASDTKLG